MRLTAVRLCALILYLPLLLACMWDRDTLLMERAEFPSALELITGKFRRHSTEFYQWRIEDRLAKLERDAADLAYLDDLAVAYDKTGDHENAISIMHKKEKLKPGLYETAANLGTFLIHSGQFEEGPIHIKRAIEINPDAHFGREIYQQLVVEYLLENKEESGELNFPICDGREQLRGGGFKKFILSKVTESGTSGSRTKAAVKGVLGMMRFGTHDSPILLELLGDLLSGFGYTGQHLAARCFLKASYEVEDPAARAAYRERARSSLSRQVRPGVRRVELTLAEVEPRFKRELVEANEWYQTLHQDELRWIHEGADVDAEFEKKYFQEPRTETLHGWSSSTYLEYAALVAIGLGIGFLIVRVFKGRRRGNLRRSESGLR